MNKVLLLFFLLLCGFSVRSGLITPPEPPEPPEPSTGTLLIETVGESTVNPTASAPYVDVWADALTPAVKTTSYQTMAGDYTARSELRHGLVQSAGTCTYPEGGAACTVSSFTDIPTGDCDLTKCNKTVSVVDGQVTKVVFKHTGVYQGWGASTIGGRDGQIITVSNTNASGAGSFRQALLDACGNNNRYIVFSTSGTITLPYADTSGLNNGLKVCGNQITIDGFTAPDPGITVANYGMNIHVLGPGGISDPKDTRDLILRGFRLRKGGFSAANCDGSGNDDCEPQVVNIETGSSGYAGANRVHNLVLDHLSISGGRDDTIGISRGSHDITLSWLYLSAGSSSHQGFLTDSLSFNLSLHHNRWTTIARRNPQITYHNVNVGSTATTAPSTISADIRYNTTIEHKESIGASHWGVLIAGGAKANIIENYFAADTSLAGDAYGPNNAIITCNPASQWLNGSTMTTCDFCNPGVDTCQSASDTFVDGNFIHTASYGSSPPVNMNNLDINVSSAIASPTVTGDGSAALSACAVLQKGGHRPLDAHDTSQESLYASPC